MTADASAFAVLGLDEGADPAEIDRAYKALIKQFHPDRSGGSAERASEINRAYQRLRPGREPEPIGWHDSPVGASAGWGKTIAAVLALLSLGCGAAALALWPKPIAPGAALAPSLAAGIDALDRPLALAAIDSAVLEATRLARSGDEMALAAESRSCYAGLRAAPSAEGLDRCVAFDEAVIRLQDRDPMRDRGPFGQIAVSGRQWGSAAAISNDHVATDSRLRQVRLRVELLLAPSRAAIAEER